MSDAALREELEADPRIAYALVFGSVARDEAHPGSDVDVAIGLAAGARLTTRELGDLASRLERGAGRPADLVLLDEAGPSLAYRVFRDGRVLLERDRAALVARARRGPSSSTSTSAPSRSRARAASSPPPPVVARPLLARKVAAIRDAVERVRAVLPDDREAFLRDRTAREVVVLIRLSKEQAVGTRAHRHAKFERIERGGAPQW